MQADKNNFIIPEMIREAKIASLFFIHLFSFFSTQIIAYCEISARFKFSRSGTLCLLCKTLKILYAKISLRKKNKKIIIGTLDNCMYSMASIGGLG